VELDRWTRGRWIGALTAAVAAASTAGSALAADVAQTSATDPATILQALIRAMLAFDDPAFPAISLDEVQGRMLAVGNLLADPAYRAGLAAFDAGAGSFALLSLPDARRVTGAWLTSTNPQQRAFITTTKAVAMIALYSSPKMWPSIGYAGPFEGRFA